MHSSAEAIEKALQAEVESDQRRIGRSASARIWRTSRLAIDVGREGADVRVTLDGQQLDYLVGIGRMSVVAVRVSHCAKRGGVLRGTPHHVIAEREVRSHGFTVAEACRAEDTEAGIEEPKRVRTPDRPLADETRAVRMGE